MATNQDDEIIKLRREKAKAEARAEEAEARADKAEEENKKLRYEKSQKRQKGCYVSSVATAARSDEARTTFYTQFVRRYPVKGGFVGSRVYRDFAIASKSSPETTEAGQARLQRAQAVAKVLMNQHRQKQSMFSSSYLDDEMQQSYALVLLMAELKSSNNAQIGHQFQFKETISDHGQLLTAKTGKRRSNTSSQPLAEGVWAVNETTSSYTVQFTVDAFVTCSHHDIVSPIAVIEYKPNQSSAEERVAQCDMYACNFLSWTRRACIGIEVAGGVDVKTWTFNAWGYFENIVEYSQKYEKSLLFEGSGWDGLLSVVRGLEASCEAFTNDIKSTELGKRLGPVVCREGKFIYKVYDKPTYRSPNLDVVQYMLDPNAEAQEEGGCTILKMKYFESNWTDDIAVEIFIQIVEKLKSLHKEYGPHGDIRLANLLSSGHIVDFDFVKKIKYPVNLVSELPDGKRHHIVENAIMENEVGDLDIEKEHDWYSLSEVMKLFQPTDTKHETEWEHLISCIKGGKVEGLSNNVEWKVSLIERDINRELVGTGPTPEKKMF